MRVYIGVPSFWETTIWAYGIQLLWIIRIILGSSYIPIMPLLQGGGPPKVYGIQLHSSCIGLSEDAGDVQASTMLDAA